MENLYRSIRKFLYFLSFIKISFGGKRIYSAQLHKFIRSRGSFIPFEANWAQTSGSISQNVCCASSFLFALVMISSI